jgi:hypothetical protein
MVGVSAPIGWNGSAPFALGISAVEGLGDRGDGRGLGESGEGAADALTRAIIDAIIKDPWPCFGEAIYRRALVVR